MLDRLDRVEARVIDKELLAYKRLAIRSRYLRYLKVASVVWGNGYIYLLKICKIFLPGFFSLLYDREALTSQEATHVG